MSGSPIDLTTLRPERVCLIKPSSLGDVIHALPVLSALRRRWPSSRMAWVVNRGLRDLLDGHPELDEVIAFDRARAGFGPLGMLSFGRFLRDLRRRRFDLVIDMQGLLRSGLMAAASGAPVRVGPADAREGAGRFYTHRASPAPRLEVHAVVRMLRFAEAFGIEPGEPRFLLPVTEDDRRWARAALAGVGSPRLVLNLGARWETKRWPPEHFAEVARRAVESRGVGLVAVGATEDRPLVDRLKAHLGPIPVSDLCGRTSLMQLAAVAEESDVFLSNDTGPLHLAASAGARTVGIYTCTSPSSTGPYGSKAVAVQTGVWCAASCVKRCGRMECMAELTPDRVWGAVLGQLDAANGANPAAA